LTQLQYAIRAGVDILQVRERDLDAAALVALVAEAVALSRGTRSRVVVNDRVDVALAAGADGVHLRGDSIPPAEVRAMTPSGFIIGRSVHGLAEAEAVAGFVDYITAGTVWPTPSKPPGAAAIGPEGLGAIAHGVDVPVVAIGGVDVERMGQLAAAGAAGAAAIGLFMRGAGGPPASCRAMALDVLVEAARRTFDSAKQAFLP
jgi:thiamine-phosphate pyrophosphorylase